jgi:protein phosphatase
MSDASSASTLRVTCVGRTVTGKVRKNNEDNLWAATVGDPAAAAGDRDTTGGGAWASSSRWRTAWGSQGRQVASRLAVETLAEELSARTRAVGFEPRDVAPLGEAAILAANERILRDGSENASREGMGTTLTVAWVLGPQVHLFQVGDSRAYLFREGRLRQLTKDQSLVEKLVDDGILTKEEAERVAGRHIILQALGSEERLAVERGAETLKDGDILLLCTDGLSGLLRHEALESAMRKGSPSLDGLCAKLVEMAEAEGGTDNITVLLARINRGWA